MRALLSIACTLSVVILLLFDVFFLSFFSQEILKFNDYSKSVSPYSRIEHVYLASMWSGLAAKILFAILLNLALGMLVVLFAKLRGHHKGA